MAYISYSSPEYDIKLIQTNFDRFTVRYGKQVKTDLNYGQAARELGTAIMHAVACDGKLDSRTRQEARRVGDTSPYFSAE
jgi:hypothetical protein